MSSCGYSTTAPVVASPHRTKPLAPMVVSLIFPFVQLAFHNYLHRSDLSNLALCYTKINEINLNTINMVLKICHFKRSNHGH